MKRFFMAACFLVLVIFITGFFEIIPVNIYEELYTEIDIPEANICAGTQKASGVLSKSSWNYISDTYSITNAILDATGKYIVKNTQSIQKTAPETLNITSKDILNLELSKLPDKILFSIEYDNNEYYNEELSDIQTGDINIPIPDTEGLYTYNIELVFDKNLEIRPYHGNLIYEFNVFIETLPEYFFSHKQIQPGEIFYAVIENPDSSLEYKIYSDISGTSYTFYEEENQMRALYPLSYTLTAGTFNFYIEDSDGNIAAKTVVDVVDKEFPIQYMTISSEVDSSTRNDEAYAEYDRYIGPVRKTNTPEKYWEGSFLRPVVGRITTEFGMRRFVNNAPTSYRHSGIDIAADTGTPIAASNSGRVILSRYLILIGNAVLIDHGYGIISWSYHMDTRAVKTGDFVKKGDVIGTVGSTGFSTGPHLHFAVSVHDIFTNPWTLFEKEPIVID